MKFSKKTTSLCAFVVGAVILTTSGLADVMLGSGYYSLKDSAKTTMAKLTNEVDNFSVDFIATVKIDGEVFAESTSKTKFDIENQASETIGTNFEKGETSESYQYSNQRQSIYKHSNNDSYSVYDKLNNNDKILDNPFENTQVADAEKIVDAFVGNLQNIVQVEESGGKKMYSGNLSDTQIPPLVNAVSSFALKYSILDERAAKRLNAPYPKSNIYVIDATGKAVENEDGIIESVIASASVSAEDSNGAKHIYSVEFSIDVKDINNTIVTAPNLEGQKVTYSSEGFEFDEKYVGKYKNDIVKEENGSFVKQGERFIEIFSVENGNAKGRYYEIYNEGCEGENARSFEFTTDNSLRHYTVINYIDEKGEKKAGVLQRGRMSNISVSLDVIMNDNNDGYSSSDYDDDFDGNFIRIFE